MRVHTLFHMPVLVAMIWSGAVKGDPVASGPEVRVPSKVRMQWMRDTTVGVYQASGMKNAKWDDAAVRTLEAAARVWGRAAPMRGDDEVDLLYASNDAIKAGCRDPLVLYARARSITGYGAKPAELAKVQEGMVEAFRKSAYPAIRKCYGLLRAAQLQIALAPDDQNAHDAAHTLAEEAMALVPEVFADARLPQEELIGVLEMISEVSKTVEGNREALRDRAVEIMEQSAQPKSAILTAKGTIAFRDGWRARGGGYADAVTPEGWRILKEQTEKGRALLDEAWDLDPNNFQVARVQLEAETNDSHGRDAMEKWFQEATRIDPDDRRPYELKLFWLEPKWHGSTEDMLAFGRECAATDYWPGLVPLVLVDAHWSIAAYRADGSNGARPHREYFTSDPKIWEEIQPVYDRYLKEPSPSNYHRTRYGVIAAYSGHWKEAYALFKSVRSDRRPQDVLFDNKALAALIKEAGAESRKISEAARAARIAEGHVPAANDLVISARWGAGDEWVDVTAKLKEWISGEDDFWADNETLGVDPPLSGRKHLEVTYLKGREKKNLKVIQDDQIPAATLRP